jgi:hypothetical protein
MVGSTMFRSYTSGYLDDGCFQAGDTTRELRVVIAPKPYQVDCEQTVESFWLDSRLCSIPYQGFVKEGGHTKKYFQALKELEAHNPAAEHDKREIFTQVFGFYPTFDRNCWPVYWKEVHQCLTDIFLRKPNAKRIDAIKEGQEMNEQKNLVFCGPRRAISFSQADGEVDARTGAPGYTYPSFRRFYKRIFFVGLLTAFTEEFGHEPTNDMNRWSDNREAERKAYWVVVGKSPGECEKIHETRNRLKRLVSPTAGNGRDAIPGWILCGLGKKLSY